MLGQPEGVAMANYKRGRRKNARAGCLLCHPYKANGTPPRLRLRPGDRRRLDAAESQVRGAAKPATAKQAIEARASEEVS